MKFYEHMAKEAFRDNGIPVPRSKVAVSAEEAKTIAGEISAPVAVKSQVLAGGRGKAGGIKFADTPDEAKAAAEEILGSEVKGYKVEKVLVEEKLQIDNELYLSVTVDAAKKKPLIIASTEGGVNIEEVPEKDIVKRYLDITYGIHPYIVREIIDSLDVDPVTGKQIAKILSNMYKIFRKYDAELVEINPLVVSGEQVIAADARLNVDDDAIFRHGDLEKTSDKTPLERKVEEIGLSFVELTGDIAVMANGAGMAMATLDILEYYGGKAANFLDAGGGASIEPTKKAIEVLLSTNPKAILVNIFGGITRCDDVANAFVQVQESTGIPVPFVIRLVGTNDKKGVKILQDKGIEAYSEIEEAAKKVVQLAQEGADTR